MHGELFNFIVSYGYPAVYVGSIFDGEVVILLASFFAHAGYLSIPKLFVVVFAGAMTGDITWFLLGRYKGQQIIKRFPRFYKFAKESSSFALQKPLLVSFAVRFLYGFKHTVAFSLGLMTDLPFKKFLLADLAGALVWVTAVGGTCYFFADLIERYIGRIRKYELGVLVVVILAVIIVNLIAKFVDEVVTKAVSPAEEDQLTDPESGILK